MKAIEVNDYSLVEFKEGAGTVIESAERSDVFQPMREAHAESGQPVLCSILGDFTSSPMWIIVDGSLYKLVKVG